MALIGAKLQQNAFQTCHYVWSLTLSWTIYSFWKLFFVQMSTRHQLDICSDIQLANLMSSNTIVLSWRVVDRDTARQFQHDFIDETLAACYSLVQGYQVTLFGSRHAGCGCAREIHLRAEHPKHLAGLFPFCWLNVAASLRAYLEANPQILQPEVLPEASYGVWREQ